MVTEVVLSIIIAVLTSTAPADTNAGINPVQHSEARASQDTTAESQGINPVQHSE